MFEVVGLTRRTDQELIITLGTSETILRGDVDNIISVARWGEVRDEAPLPITSIIIGA